MQVISILDTKYNTNSDTLKYNDRNMAEGASQFSFPFPFPDAITTSFRPVFTRLSSTLKWPNKRTFKDIINWILLFRFEDQRCFWGKMYWKTYTVYPGYIRSAYNQKLDITRQFQCTGGFYGVSYVNWFGYSQIRYNQNRNITRLFHLTLP